MKYCQIAPGPAVSRFVEFFWILEDDSGAVQRIVPDGYPALILNLLRPFESFAGGSWNAQPVCFFAGQTTRPLLIRSRGQAQILGVSFLPHGASGLLGLPMDQLTDSIVPIGELSPALYRELDRVRETGPLLIQPLLIQLARFETVLQTLGTQAGAEDRLVSHAVSRIIDAGGGLDVRTLADDLSISPRQLERRFRSCVGIAPKLFSRIQRFQGVFHAIEQGRHNWVDAALSCGYYDQAHLIRDFRDFAGEAPAALLEEADLAWHFLRREAMSHSSNTGAAAFR
jgi:AraC-like DNA-binding protein